MERRHFRKAVEGIHVCLCPLVSHSLPAVPTHRRRTANAASPPHFALDLVYHSFIVCKPPKGSPLQICSIDQGVLQHQNMIPKYGTGNVFFFFFSLHPECAYIYFFAQVLYNLQGWWYTRAFFFFLSYEIHLERGEIGFLGKGRIWENLILFSQRSRTQHQKVCTTLVVASI